jgi:hypothetical protein
MPVRLSLAAPSFRLLDPRRRGFSCALRGEWSTSKGHCSRIYAIRCRASSSQRRGGSVRSPRRAGSVLEPSCFQLPPLEFWAVRSRRTKPFALDFGGCFKDQLSRFSRRFSFLISRFIISGSGRPTPSRSALDWLSRTHCAVRFQEECSKRLSTGLSWPQTGTRGTW